MQKIMKRIFILIGLCLLAAALVSCEQPDAYSQAEKNGCTRRVTYDLGNGRVNGNASLLYMVEDNALLPELGVASGTTRPVLAGYRLTGYYTLSEDGKTETDWNFATDRATSDITLYARWAREFTVSIRYGEGNKNSISATFSEEKPTANTFRVPNYSGHTFYGFYLDAEYTRPVTFPYTHKLDADNPNETVYAKFLDGNYTIIRTASDFKGTINAGTKYYIDADVDLTGVKITVAETFSGAFYGNGHTITGLSVSRTQSRTSDAYGMFGRITSTAVFDRITFTGVTVSVALSNEQNSMISHIGAFAGAVSDGATFTDVTFAGSLVYDLCGRDISDTLVTGSLFGEYDGVDISSITADCTVTEKSA